MTSFNSPWALVAVVLAAVVAVLFLIYVEGQD